MIIISCPRMNPLLSAVLPILTKSNHKVPVIPGRTEYCTLLPDFTSAIKHERVLDCNLLSVAIVYELPIITHGGLNLS